MKANLLFGLTSALALAGCNNSGTEQAPEGGADTAVASANPLPSDTAVAAADTSAPQAFVDMAASSDMYETQAGELASKNGKSEKVKSFGAMMVKDHTSSSAKLKAAVAKAGDAVKVPTAMQPKHQALLDELKNAGENFDATYAKQQVAAHGEALRLMQSQAQSGTSEPLKSFAAEVTPVIKHHGEEAAKLP